MKLAIEGMHCQRCVEHVRKAIARVDGARAEQVEVGSATVQVDASKAAQVVAAICAAGYQAREAS
jgi:copper chaperone CopZ